YFRNVRIYEGTCGNSRTVAQRPGTIVIGNEGEGDLGFNLFPNPATEILNIELQHVDADCLGRIMDATGKQLWQGTVQAGFNQINLIDIPSGLYYFNVVKADGTTVTKKFVKSRN
ncbi:MAG: T9SS type A sorting domain-containing protein, partial [Saprospiraceae bacterium]|nr:T9SS type A sorting domain-containing protein [Saprospiraceae bacterium]